MDLLQLESVRMSATSRKASESKAPSEPVPEPVRTHDSKHPALRRAALVFMGQLFNAMAVSEQSDQEVTAAQQAPQGTPAITLAAGRISESFQYRPPIHPGLMQRAGNVLGYLQATDVDSLAAHQAGEALALLRQLRWPLNGNSS